MRKHVISCLISGMTCAQIDAMLGTSRGYAMRVAKEEQMLKYASANVKRYTHDVRKSAYESLKDATKQALIDAAKAVTARYRERSCYRAAAQG